MFTVMKKIHISLLALLFVGLVMATGCNKLLDEKSDQKLAIPSTLTDFQALMDNFTVLNSSEPISLELSADDYSTSDADLAGSSEPQRRMYSWQKDYLFAPANNDWSTTYKAVYHCSSVISGLESSALSRDVAFNSVKGQALVFRSKFYMQAMAVWGKSFLLSSGLDPGVPLRPSLNFNEPTVRASLKEGYDKSIEGLKMAVPLLPVKSIHPYRPSRAAAYGLLARALLYTGRYEDAGFYADSCIKLSDQLIDFNKLNGADRYPFALFNSEVVFDTYAAPGGPVVSSRARIDPRLMESYHSNDLRKTLFFTQTGGNYFFKGTYHQPLLFFGVATDEMYLTLAECLVRTGRVQDGLATLDKLLVSRFKTGTYSPAATVDAQTALKVVLQERRKELVMRGLRWMDIKRLNAEGANIVISRNFNGQKVSLLPNDPRYALPIPEDVIQLSGIPQNER
ncbi:MAG: RagB/SusD family nutrient uptake outer membrane protein [Pedobacter sp.]|nr:MAG: RagB/SusD family nutrient uptake outer membrane protein [Pedobacter sp.]